MRILNPSLLLLGLIALPLPWVEIQCVARPKARHVERLVVVTQTGIQTMKGEASFTDRFKKLVEPRAKDLRESASEVLAEKSEALRSDPVILVMVWMALLFLGAVVGYCLKTGRRRAVFLTTIAAAASACLVVQGFILKFPLKPPLDWAVPAAIDIDDSDPDGLPRQKPEVQTETVFGMGYWLAVFLSALALAGGIFEWFHTAPGGLLDDRDITRLCYGAPKAEGDDSAARDGIISYQCPECSASLHSRQEAAGMTIRCQKCRSTITVPSRSDGGQE
jgi:DNA-directed RNA polymerase subunit RPC12/RpoP